MTLDDAIKNFEQEIGEFEGLKRIHADYVRIEKTKQLLEWLKELRERLKNPKRWIDVYHYGFGYTKCPYCGDETGWYNPMSNKLQSDLKNNQREHCSKCGKRVYAREGWLVNQPPIEEITVNDFKQIKGENDQEYIRQKAVAKVKELSKQNSPSQMPDSISRQDAIDALSHMCSEDENGITVSRANVNSMLRALPPVQSGHWVDDQCSECGYGVMPWNNTPFCPNCGAKMRG